jgi:hypothetical protein
MSYYTSQLGSWFVKGYQGVIYIIATSDVYPNDIAIECVDELYETVISVKRSSWGRPRRAAAASKRRQESMDACCRGLATKYGTLDEGSAAHAIMTDIPTDVRDPYVNHIQELMSKVDRLQHQMQQNIQNELKNIETAEAIQEKSQECREMAKIFKKRTSKLKWNTWYKDHRGVFVGTTVCSIAGGVGGFLIGGPAGAGVLSGMGSVAAAQAIEASAGAAILGVTFLGASSAFKSWFINQSFLPLVCGGSLDDVVVVD